MATSGIVNGTKFGVYVGTGANTLIGFSTSCSLSVTHSPRTTTNALSGAFSNRMAGSIDWEVSCDAFVSMQGTTNHAHQLLSNFLLTRQSFYLRFQTKTAGDWIYTGSALMTSFSIDAPNEESSTFSVSFAANGPLYVQSVSPD